MRKWELLTAALVLTTWSCGRQNESLSGPSALPPTSASGGQAAILVVDGRNDVPLPGVKVETNSGTNVTTDAQGVASLNVSMSTPLVLEKEGVIQRKTLWRGERENSPFSLWPLSGEADVTFVGEFVYRTNIRQQPLTRVPNGTTVGVLLPRNASDEVRQAFDDAVSLINDAIGGPVTFQVVDGSGGGRFTVSVSVDPGDSFLLANQQAGGYTVVTTSANQIVGARIVYRSDWYLGTRNAVAHELGHVFGVGHHHLSQGGIMSLNATSVFGSTDFSASEKLAMRMMTQRPTGNAYPDDDQGAGVQAASRAGAQSPIALACF
ncbi:MAG TPA: hypothetical protein VMC43_02975 [Candidatus Paceibacterota bacterium]|nr:hypothetical protein [Candidatus Paceibacterota bacterium]